MADPAATKSITFEVRDLRGQPYNVLLHVAEQTASGTLAFTSESGEAQQHTLTQIQTSGDGKTLTCRAGLATATLTVEDASIPPRLHLVARVFVPVVDATYTLSQEARERFVGWLSALRLRAST